MSSQPCDQCGAPATILVPAALTPDEMFHLFTNGERFALKDPGERGFCGAACLMAWGKEGGDGRG